MRLLIVHSHFRPGGVRRVIEIALPHLVEGAGPRFGEVVLLGGEPPDPAWLQTLMERLHPASLRVEADNAFGYVAEQSGAAAEIRLRIRQRLTHWLSGASQATTVVWAHNQSLARNLHVTRELTRTCALHGLRLVFHHHDWWFDNRWQRWPEMGRSGARSIQEVARTILPCSPNVRHATINQSDAAALAQRFHGQAGWLPNPASPSSPPGRKRAAEAKRWVADVLGTRGPYWLLPCRLLRRKNIAEALLLTRWLRPEACLVTTGGASSADEQVYANALRDAARKHRWPLRLGVLERGEANRPTVPELLAASEAALLTSLLEGFGLPFLEAVSAGRPLVARSLPNVAPDLARFGFHFPHTYAEVLVDPALFNWKAEFGRQSLRFRRWRAAIPHSCRRWVGTPFLLETEGRQNPVPFSRLTLAAQLEVLAVPPAESWAACAPINPPLLSWRELAAGRRLVANPWPESADRWLGGPAYGRRFMRLLKTQPQEPPDSTAGGDAHAELMEGKLASANLYPLLWTPEP